MRRRAAVAAEAVGPPARASDLAAQAAQSQVGDALQAARLLDAQRQRVRVADPMYQPRKEFIGTTREAQQQQGQAERAQARIEEQQAQQTAAYYNDFQARELAEQAVAETRERQRIDRQQAQLEAVREADNMVSTAADAMAAAPGVDAERFWASRTGAQKFFAVMSMAARGALGDRDYMRDINTAIAADIDEQKSDIADARATLGARQQEADNARTMWRNTLAQTGDERAAEAVMRQARLEAFKRQLTALQAQQGAQVAHPATTRLIAQIDQEMAKNKLALDQMQAANAPYRTVTVNRIGPAERQMLAQVAKQGVETGADLTQQAFQLRGKEAEFEAKQKVEQAKVQAKSGEEVRKQASDFGNKVAKLDVGLGLAQDFLDEYAKTGDIAGYGSVKTPWGIGQGHTWGADAQRTQNRLGMLNEILTTNVTGAVASPEQRELFENIASGRASEEEVAQGVRDIMRVFELEKQSIASGYDPRAIEMHANTAAVPRGEVNVRGLGGSAADPTAGGRIQIDE